MILRQLATIESAEHILISEIVAEAEGEFGWLAGLLTVGGDEPFGDLAFVDEGGADFEVGFALHDFDVPFLADGLLEFFLAFARVVLAEGGVGGAVVPGEGAAFAFDEGALR